MIELIDNELRFRFPETHQDAYFGIGFQRTGLPLPVDLTRDKPQLERDGQPPPCRAADLFAHTALPRGFRIAAFTLALLTSTNG